MDESLPETYLGDGRGRRRPGPARVALAVSVFVHLMIASWWLQLPETTVVTEEASVLELTLQSPKPAEIPDPQQTVEDTEAAQEPTENHDTIAEAEPGEVVESEQAPSELAETEVTAPEPQFEPPALNLDLPSDWSKYLDTEQSLTIRELPFNPTLGELKAKAEEGKARRQLLAMRERAIYGLSDEEFGIREGFGNRMIKVDGRCYILREATELGGGDQWSMTGCPDPRQHPMTLPLLEFDAVGRVMAD